MYENLKTEKLINFKDYLRSGETKSIEINTDFIRDFILATTLCLQGSNSSIQEVSELLFKIKISTGYISEVLSGSGDKAEIINNSINLEKISQGALDEIFSLRKPVLVGVDPQSTYIFLNKLSNKRDGASWGYYLQDKKEKQSLNLEETVMDGAKGMRLGVKEVFDASIQYDQFHAQREWHKIERYYENQAYKLIKENYDVRPGKTKSAPDDMNKAIDLYEDLGVLIRWLDEVLSLPNIEIALFREENFKIVLELLSTFKDEKILKLKVYLESWQAELLSFDSYLKPALMNLIKEYGYKAVKLCWWQEFSDTDRYWHIESKLYKQLSYREINNLKSKIKEIRKKILRASSIVEGMNSLLRRYVYSHRGINQKQLELITFYLNHRKYRRSQLSQRVGKSPVELLTETSYRNWLEILKAG